MMVRRSGRQLPYSPPIQLSLIVRPTRLQKPNKWTYNNCPLKLCSPSKTLSEEVLYPNILQNPPSIPDWGFPLFPLVGDCVGKLFWPFHTWYFSHLVIFSGIRYVLCIQQIKKIIHCNWQSCILPQWLYCKVVLILPLLTYHIRSKNCCQCISHK